MKSFPILFFGCTTWLWFGGKSFTILSGSCHFSYTINICHQLMSDGRKDGNIDCYWFRRRGKPKLTCSERCLERRKKPSRHPITTANTDKMRRPFCWHTFLTRLHTAPRAMVTRPLLLPAQTAIQTPWPKHTNVPRGQKETDIQRMKE